MLTMGVDIGSTTCKAAIISDGKEVIAKGLVAVGTGTRGPMQVYREVLDQAGLSRDAIARVVATGYGRLNFVEATERSELSWNGNAFLMSQSKDDHRYRRTGCQSAFVK